MVQLTIATSAGLLAGSRLDFAATAQTEKPQMPEKRYAEPVSAGLQYFKQQAKRQLPLAENLLREIRTKDLERAKTAYIDSRPPYEQIEVLAICFEQTDKDVDARPYAFDLGETDPEFRGFHRIEALLFRDGETEAAVPYAEQLIKSLTTLLTDLDQRQNFDAKKHFEGMIALANEVGAKKISSEEETWSDQSLLIFNENWRGINSQFQPFAPLLMTKNGAIVDEMKAAYQNALASIAEYFRPNQVAAAPYSSVGAQKRGEITRATYRLRDGLLKAQEALQLG
jgi:iron uptake system component EfeO